LEAGAGVPISTTKTSATPIVTIRFWFNDPS
jgi:hypothetical protein